jgi:DNA processing protein
MCEPGDPSVASAVRVRGAADLIADQRSALRRAAEDLQRWEAAQIEVLIPGDLGWPTQLDDLDQPPLVLYARGRPLRRSLLRSVTVVGSRSASTQGLRLATSWSASLAERQFTVVSGAAFGIDAAAHRGALSAGGPTVAVLAAGVDVASPAAHADLLSQIAERGTIVSELPPGTAPARHRFLARNRLIAACTPGTVVVQAAPRSGALATARRAAALHRIVMAVPGSVGEAAHAGCHALIRDGVAVLVRDAADVAELVGPIGRDGPGSLAD